MTSALFGDWSKLKHVLRKLSENGNQYQSIVTSMADDIVTRIWDLIEQQAIELEPLVEEYRKQKVAEGYDERILIKTGDFLNSIAVTDIETNGDDITVFISVDDGVTNTGISMKELAYYIEYGTVNQPARMPLHRTWEEISQSVKSEVASRLKAEIGSDLRG